MKWTGVRYGQSAIDVCCGSGDLALRLSETVGPEGRVVGLDFAAAQLRRAAQKERDTPAFMPKQCNVEWVEGDALSLPYEENTFHAATIGYGLRNVSSIPQALSELHRVLKPGGTAAILDFNNSTDPIASAAQGFLLDNVVVPIASLNGVEAEYRYLRPSIERYPPGSEQVQLAREAGFGKAVHYELSPGNFMGCLVCTK